MIERDWIVTTTYDKYNDFLSLFSHTCNSHRDHGGNTVYYLDDYKYPDVENNFINYVKNVVKDKVSGDIEFAKSWWCDYPLGSYSGVHTHTPGTQFTCILYLTDNITDLFFPYAGYLFSISKKEGYYQFNPKAGDLVIMDGTVWHGTYPATSDRKVFVCDFSYELHGDKK